MLGYLITFNPTLVNAGSIVEFVSLIGVFGFSYRKAILNKTFWMVTFVFALLLFIKGMFYSPFDLYRIFGSIDFMVIASLWLPFLPLLPIPYILYQYANKCDEIWNRN